MRALLRSLRRTRCPICAERHRRLDAHLNTDHYGES